MYFNNCPLMCMLNTGGLEKLFLSPFPVSGSLWCPLAWKSCCFCVCTSSVCLCGCPNFLLHKDTCDTRLGSTLMMSFLFDYSKKPLSLIKSLFWSTRANDANISFWEEHNLSHSNVILTSMHLIMGMNFCI